MKTRAANADFSPSAWLLSTDHFILISNSAASKNSSARLQPIAVPIEGDGRASLTIIFPARNLCMHLQESTNLSGDTQLALDFAANVLATHGFTIERREPGRMEFIGPGMNSTRQNPLLGASRIMLEAQSDRLSITAELGGVESMRRFMLVFPLVLGLGLGCGFAILNYLSIVNFQFFGVNGVPVAAPWAAPMAGLLLGLLPTVPWLFLAPWIARRLQAQTRRALQTLLRNAAQIS